MADDLEAKKQAIAEAIDGQVVDASGRVSVSIKGSLRGYPVTLEAFLPHWPFGVMYTLETTPGLDPDAPPTRPNAVVTLYPRVGRGIGSIVSNLLLFEGGGMRISNKRLAGNFNFSFNNREVTERLLSNPNVENLLLDLDDKARFSEMKIRTDAGIYLAQPKAFKDLTPAHCTETFGSLAYLADILVAEF